MISTNSDVTEKRLPGEEGVWIFIMLDMMTFGLFFATYSVHRALQPSLYAESQILLHSDYGLINTLFLICASWLVATAIIDARAGRTKTGSRRLFAATFLGCCFVALKAVEYTQLAQQGITISTNEFFMFYFCLTIVHLLHTVIGIGILCVIALKTARGGYVQSQSGLECGATYWHMVDLLWIFLFPLLYLLR